MSAPATIAPHPAWSGAALDAQYFMRGAVPSWERFLDGWAADSASARAQLPGELDLPYGPGGDERLDVFVPPHPVAKAPVQILIHGGYWRALHKDDFAFLAPPLAAAGVITVNVNYTLCPHITMDALVEQCRRAVLWTRANIGRFGGDPDRLHVTGHSAGGHLAAMMAVTDWHERAGDGKPFIRGICALSGLYDLRPLRHCFVQEDLRMNEAEAIRNSPLNYAAPAGTAVLLGVGVDETEAFRWHTKSYAVHCATAGVPCATFEVPGQHHYSLVNVLCKRGSSLRTAWLESCLA